MIEAGIRSRPARSVVDVARQLVDDRLRAVLDDGEAAGEVAVERRVADRHLRLVAGRQHEPAELVRQRHHEVAADARLEVLLGDVRRRCRRRRPRARRRRPASPARSAARTARRRGCRASVRASSCVSAEEYGEGITTAATPSGPSASAAMQSDERGVDPAREAEHDASEAVLAHVVAQAGDERGVDLGGRVEQRRDRAADVVRVARAAPPPPRAAPAARASAPPRAPRAPARAGARRAAAASAPPRGRSSRSAAPR